MTTPHIRILTAGGTIDKIYFDAKSEYQVGEPNIGEVLREWKMGFTFTIESVVRKDSLEMTTADRLKIVEALKADQSPHILITHGTDTMVDTARFLAERPESKGRTIVLTGALAPATFKHTDAVFNIGCAVAAVQTLAHGVYIAMNGRIFPHHNVRKNVALGQFEPLHQ